MTTASATTAGSAGAVRVEDVVAVTAEVLTSLGVEVFELPEWPALADETMTAAVSVTGTWGGHITVSCSSATARALTALMLGLEDAEIVEADVADAVGELSNMVGGSIKGMLPPPNTLSLPHVVLSGRGTHHWPHARPLCRTALSAPYGPLLVDVWTSTPEGSTP